jgi:hypothetical protein
VFKIAAVAGKRPPLLEEVERYTRAARRRLGLPTNYVDADGETVLSYWQAVDKVRELGKPNSAAAAGSITVQEAFDNYLPTLEAKNARSARTTKGRVKKHILPRLGACRVVDLTKNRRSSRHP